MKKLLLICAIGLSLTALTACTQKESSDNIGNDYDSCLYGGCAKISDDGYQCRRCSEHGSYFCYAHR